MFYEKNLFMISTQLLITLVAVTLTTAVQAFTITTASVNSLAAPNRRSIISTSMTSTDTSNTGGGLFLFDFDGVVCDSCDECTVSALRTCQKLDVLREGAAPDYPPQWLFDKMREIRPAIETGWQIPVLLYVFLDQKREAEKPNGAKAMSVDEIIANYERLVDETLETWGKSEADMIDTFGGVRDTWIKEDLTSWLDINSFYPGVPESLSNCKGEGILVTTKQQRFAIALCRHAGVGTEPLPDDRIYGLGQYKNKADVIVDRMTTGGYKPEETYFFEDRWPTLAKCLKDERLDGVRLHLCSWGYCTESELALARAEPRVEVLELEDFVKVVKA